MRPKPTIVEHFIVAREVNDSQARLDFKGFAKDKQSSLFLLQRKSGVKKIIMRPEPTWVEHFIVAREGNDPQARLDLKGFAKDKSSSLFLL